jgi:hypothetical protein
MHYISHQISPSARGAFIKSLKDSAAKISKVAKKDCPDVSVLLTEIQGTCFLRSESDIRRAGRKASQRSLSDACMRGDGFVDVGPERR